MENKIGWLVACVSEFAQRFNLSAKEAFNYLHLFKGMDFWQRHYEVEHTLSFDDAIDDAVAICLKNGGVLQ